MQKTRRDMQRRTRRNASTIGGAAPDTTIGRADPVRSGARPGPLPTPVGEDVSDSSSVSARNQVTQINWPSVIPTPGSSGIRLRKTHGFLCAVSETKLPSEPVYGQES